MPESEGKSCSATESVSVQNELASTRDASRTSWAVIDYLTQDHPTKTGPLLIGSQKGGKLTGGMSTSAINQRIRALGKRIGVTTLILSPHDLRHFWATSATEAGTDLESLKQAGGWSSLEMPLRYIKEREIANEKVKLAH